MGTPHDHRYERQGKTTRPPIYKDDNADNNSTHQYCERQGDWIDLLLPLVAKSKLSKPIACVFVLPKPSSRNLNYPN